MEKIKYIKRQDCGLKTTAGKSGDSGINLSQDVFALLNTSNIGPGSEAPITFEIYRQEFVVAVDFIRTLSELYVTDSKSYSRVKSVDELCNNLISQLNDYFAGEVVKTYTCSLSYKEDKRAYILGMKTGSFSARNFLVEGLSAVRFIISDNKIEFHIMSNISDGATLTAKESCQKEERLIISDNSITGFAYKCISYFSELPEWDNISNFIDDVDSLREGDSIKVYSTGSFALVGMFKCTTEGELAKRYNTPKRRWYSEPFTIGGKTVFLSTEWYPSTRSDGSAYGLMIPDLGKFISACFGSDYVYRKNGNDMELWHIEDVTPGVTSFSIKSIMESIAATGLQYDGLLVKRFAFSLMTKPFVILSGLAGSGKTQLALAFAKALIQDRSQLCTVSVGADWTNREPLLGYPNALDSSKYVRPESGVLDLLIEANKPTNSGKPYFLILDEMNMSYVERYFADFLSAMESHEPIKLWSGADGDNVPSSVKLPRNLYIIGTINVDETTYMFSPKVLDRANVIEFKISGDEMNEFLGNIKNIDRDSIMGKAAGMGESFVEKSRKAEITPDSDIQKTLVSFFNELKSVNAEFGFRSATEIYKYIDVARSNDDSTADIDENAILDSAIVQKLLPKLHGSRKKLVPVLKTLWCFCGTGNAIDDATSVPDQTKYPLTADKVLRMYRSALDNGFTSFSEA